MQKIRILLPRSILSPAIALLHDAGVIEIVTADYTELERGKPLAQYDEIAEQLVRLRAVLQTLGKRTVRLQRIDGKQALEETRALQLEEGLRQLAEQKEGLEARQGLLQEQLKLVQTLRLLGDIDFSQLQTDTLDYWLGRCERKLARRLETRLREKIPVSEISGAYLNEREDLLLVVYRKGQPVEEEFAQFAVQKIDVRGLTRPMHAADPIRKELETNRQKQQEIQRQLGALADQQYARVASLEKALRVEADRAEIAFRLNFSEKVALLEGWVKVPDLPRLEQELTLLNPAIVVERLEEDAHELPPTSLENPAVVQPFEYITSNFSLPHAKEIDPTAIYGITIPLLYGMIVGDVFYGILSYFLAGGIIRKFKQSAILSNVGKIWQVSAFPSILFGLLFDEWAGMGHLHLLEILSKWGLPIAIHAPLYFPVVHRVHELPVLIAITIMVGLVHLALGFILGAVNQWHHHRKHAIAKLAWLLVEISGTVAVASYTFGVFPASIGNMGAVGLGIGALILLLTEGPIGLIEIPGLAGNALSYLRIGVIGVAGVLLAEIINEAFLPLPEHGLLALLFFPLFVILHAVNAFIAMFEALIQGGRLNIIEFRSKFLTGGGKPFEPFSYTYD